MTESLVISGSGTLVPEDRLYWTSPDVFNRKRIRLTFTTLEVAKVFFGRSRTWFTHVVVDFSTELDCYEMPRSEKRNRARRWRLYDIERFAHLLLREQRIGLDHFGLVLNVVKSVATMNGFDVGDKRFRELWKVAENPVHARAMTLVAQQYAADQNTPTVGQTEQLADLAAWAIRRLENHLEGTQE